MVTMSPLGRPRPAPSIIPDTVHVWLGGTLGQSGAKVEGPAGLVAIEPKTHHAALDIHLMLVKNQKLTIIETAKGSAKVLDFEHMNQLFELFDDLLQRGVVAPGDDRHARGFRVFGWAYVQSVDVVAASAEQAGHASEHPELVFDQN